MESERAVLLCFLIAGMFSKSYVSVAMGRGLEGFGDQKNYYSPDPHTTTPSSPRHTGDRLKPECSCPTPPHGGHGGTPPHHSGGGSHRTTPPSHGGGGYYTPSPVPIIVTPPSPPLVNPGTPYVTPTPYVVPPPSSPSINIPPAPPLVPDPNIPGTCNYWSTHPAAIWAVFGYWGTIGEFFGLPATAAFGSNLSVQEALANTRTDGIGALFREGTASLLNSMANKKFVFTTQQVKDGFTAAMGSNKAAASQAELFKLANEGHFKH